jgi:hypothetical protein
MKYKLITLPRGTAKLPILAIPDVVNLKQGQSLIITPETLNYVGGNTFENSGYTATISDVRLMSTFMGAGISDPAILAMNTTTTLGTNMSKTVVGTTINLKATTTNVLFGTSATAGAKIYATLTIEGRDSGARLTIPVTISKI